MADTYVVDTGVFLRWFVNQVGWKHARQVREDFVAGQTSLRTVDSVRIELAHVLRTHGLLRGRIDRAQYVAAARAVDDLGVTIRITDSDALERAAGLAVDLHLRFFDALLVDDAIESGWPLLTSDVKLARAVASVVSTEVLRGL